MRLELAEYFLSINGEGRWAGELAVFLRFTGCNLRCGYCDTMWANEPNCPTQSVSLEEILTFLQDSGAKHVTVTGGEPLLQSCTLDLVQALVAEGYPVEIETNGSVDITPFLLEGVSLTMDYKMPSSAMESQMRWENLALLRDCDTLKMVSQTEEDLHKARYLVNQVGERVLLLLSPVYGQIEAKDMVDYLIEHKLHRIKLQLQLHKYIWNPEERGV